MACLGIIWKLTHGTFQSLLRILGRLSSGKALLQHAHSAAFQALIAVCTVAICIRQHRALLNMQKLPEVMPANKCFANQPCSACTSTCLQLDALTIGCNILCLTFSAKIHTAELCGSNGQPGSLQPKHGPERSSSLAWLAPLGPLSAWM